MRKIRNKYSRPKKPWDTARIKEEKGIIKEYGLRRKREIRVAEEFLRGFRNRARKLIATKKKEEEKVLIEKLVKLGLLKEGAGLDDILALTVKEVLDRRLQTLVLKKGFADTAREARQKIVHGHVRVGERKATAPASIITVHDEAQIVSKKGGKANA
jgi:small subunit ribosomal protein S4